MNEKKKKGNSESKRKMGSLSEIFGREKSKRIEMAIGDESNKTDKKRGKRGTMEETEGEIYNNLQSEGYGNNDCGSEDSNFYDFDEDRVERSFKKGQVWAIYNDDDGVPRNYGLIDDIVYINPFEVRMSWLDVRNDGDERLTSWEKRGFHISCGRFEVAKNDTTDLLNIFSHVLDCERAAKKLYRIYPKKGSIWALYSEKALDKEGSDSLSEDKRSYDIVVFLTSYNEMYGLSLAYLDKVDGFRAVFKRREFGCQAIRWLDKVDFKLFSHQIPAIKLSGEEASHLSGDCWELDPASLPSDLLTIF